MSGASPVRKRKRGGGSFNAIDCKRRLRASNETRKRQSTNAAQAPKRRERYRSPGPSKPPPEAQSRADVAGVEKGEDTGAKSTTESAKNEANAKELQALGRTEINHGSANNDVEYEVERILAVRLRRGNLQYRVRWLGYEADPEWYNASNFKNSPHKLREFHEANPTKPGPPRRLSHWERCYDEDRDADDFSDDDKPGKIVHGGRRGVRLDRAAI